MAFYEVRQYVVRPGKMAEWLKMFDDEIVPFQVGKGMVIPAVFSGEEDESVFIWLRRFNSEEERVQLYKAVYEDPFWTDEMAPRIGECIDRELIQVQRVTASGMSILQ
ncbi:MAG: NIPSNAP family protein [Pseudomonadota bacterium]